MGQTLEAEYVVLPWPASTKFSGLIYLRQHSLGFADRGESIRIQYFVLHETAPYFFHRDRSGFAGGGEQIGS